MKKTSLKAWQLWASAIGVIVVSVIGIIVASRALQDVRLSQETIQKMIDAKLPVEKVGTLSKVVIEKINLKIEKQPLISMAGYIEFMGRKVSMEAETKGELVCDSRKLYFHPSGIQIKSLLLSGFEVSKFKKDMVSLGVATAASVYLDNFPIYKVKGVKGWLVGAAVKSVEFNEGEMLVHLSLWNLTVSVALLLFTLLASVAFLFALMVNPEILESIFRHNNL
jgi:hypothetical protein